MFIVMLDMKKVWGILTGVIIAAVVAFLFFFILESSPGEEGGYFSTYLGIGAVIALIIFAIIYFSRKN